MLVQYQLNGIDGYQVCALDGSGIFHSKTKDCEYCIAIRDKEGNIIRYEHKLLVAMTLGFEGRNTILDFEIWKGENPKNISKSEGELTTAPAIISRLPDYIDIVCGDALYCTVPYLKTVCGYDDNETSETIPKKRKNAIVRLKDENLRLNVHKEAVKSFESNGVAGTFEVKEDNETTKVTYYDAKELDMVDSKVSADAKYKTIKVRVLWFKEEIINKTKFLNQIED
jgi:hypothetical protein